MTAYDDAVEVLRGHLFTPMVRDSEDVLRDSCACGWVGTSSGGSWHGHLLDALLAAKQTQTCPNPDCDGGRVYYGTDELHWDAKPCPDCSSGVVVGTEPLLLIAPKQVGWLGPYGIIPGGMDNDPAPNWVPVYRRAGSPDE